jgi:hypothetical protein
MSDNPTPPKPAGEPTDRPHSERRRNHALRELIDEMLASIRTASHGHLWTAEERAQYERELAVIMSRVRTEAVGTTKDSA